MNSNQGKPGAGDAIFAAVGKKLIVTAVVFGAVSIIAGPVAGAAAAKACCCVA